MKTIAALGALCAVASAAETGVKKRGSITPVYTHGNAFWAGSERFYIRGVDYQPGGSSAMIDPIADPSICKRDIPYFQQLGINTVRVYTVDNAKNHDECMNALADAGIYLALDVNNPLYSLNRDDPAPSYNNVYLQSIFATIDAFKDYPNTLLFFSGNEVINAPNNTNTAPYIKAVTRDMKNYIKAQSSRIIPVGYSAADIVQNRLQTAEYMNCGSDGMARSDFFSFNDYEYCDSSFVVSGWANNVKLFSKYALPLFMSEFGCNTVLPRTFTEIKPLYSHKMTPVYSGGLLYEYTEEADNPNYGLVQIEPGNKVKLLPNFDELKTAYAQNPPPSGSGGFTTSNPISQCPPYSHLWEVKTEELPAIPVPAEKYMTQGAGKPLGLKKPGSQDTGTPSTGFVSNSSPGETEHSSAPSSTKGDGSSDGTSTSAASSQRQGILAPVACAALAIVSAMLGSALI